MTPRMSAADRKEVVLEAALAEFGKFGMHGMSIDRVAEAAGVSQPYIFRLFGTKTDLISAAIERDCARVQHAFRDAAENRDRHLTPLQAMGMRYLQIVQQEPNLTRCQLHSWAAASDPAIRDVARVSYRKIWTEVAEVSGAPADQVRDFMALGKLLTVLSALDLTDLFGDPIATLKEGF